MLVAEKSSESLQDVSQAVTAITSSELEIKNIVDFVGLSSVAPGVTVAKNEGYKTVISIRGVGDETNQNAIAAPSVDVACTKAVPDPPSTGKGVTVSKRQFPAECLCHRGDVTNLAIGGPGMI